MSPFRPNSHVYPCHEINRFHSKLPQQKSACTSPLAHICHMNTHVIFRDLSTLIIFGGQSRWPYGLKLRSEVASLLGSRVRIPLRAWIFVSCVCCVLCRWRPLGQADHSSRGVLPDARVCLIECHLETSTRRWSRRELGCCATGRNHKIIHYACMISDFRRHVYEICVVLGYYVALSRSSVPTFRDLPSLRFVVPKRRYRTTTQRCVITRKREDLLIREFSPAFCYFLALRQKCLPQHPVLEHHQHFYIILI
jgi:hypothetical protein